MAMEVADLFVRVNTMFDGAGLAKGAAEGESFSKKFTTAMNNVAKGTVLAAVGIGVESVKMAADFQTQMTKLVTSAGESSNAIKNVVGPGILKMSVDTATSVKKLGDAMYWVESGGFHGAQGLAVLQAAAEGARAEGANVHSVANALTTVLNNYFPKAAQMSADALQHLSIGTMNQLITAVGLGKTTMELFSNSLSTVLPEAAAVHISFAEVAGALAVMTAKGETAEHATQLLNATIRNIDRPSAIAAKAMAQMGLDATDLQQHLGERGLTGTLGMIESAILKHMGPSGLYLQKSFNDSAAAAKSAKTMYDSMSGSVKDLATKLLNGSISVGDYAKAVKGLPVDQAAVAGQFLTMTKSADGFNSQLRAGKPSAQTFLGLLNQIMGGASGMQVQLELGGASAVIFGDDVKQIGGALSETGNHVKGWGEITETFNFKLQRLNSEAQVLAIKLGDFLIPKIEAVAGWFSKHIGLTQTLAGIIGGLLVANVVRLGVEMGVNLVKAIMQAGAAMSAFAAKNTAGMWESTIGGAGRATAAMKTLATAEAEAAVVAQATAAKMAGQGQQLALFAAPTAAIKGVAVAEAEAGAAAVAQVPRFGAMAAAETGAATAAKGLGASLLGALGPIGLIVGAAGLLGHELGKLTGVGDHTALNMTKMTQSFIEAGRGSGQAQQQIEGVYRVLATMNAMGGSNKAISSFDQGLVQLVQSGHADLAAQMVRRFDDAVTAGGQNAQGANTKLHGYNQALADTKLQSELTKDSTNGLANSEQRLSGQFDQMSNKINASAALENLHGQFLQLTDSVQANGATLDASSAKGNANRQVIAGLAQQIASYGATVKSQTGDQNAANQAMAVEYDRLMAAGKAAGFNTGQVQALLGQLGLIRPSYSTQISANTNPAYRAVNDFVNWANYQSAAIRVSASGVKAQASGGIVTGPGTGTSDSVPMRLSAGEYVIRASSVNKMPRRLFDALNMGDTATARDILAGSSGRGGGGMMVGQTVNNFYFTIHGSVLAERDLLEKIETRVLQVNSRNINNGLAFSR